VLSQSDLEQTNLQAVSAVQNLSSDRNRLASMRNIRPVDLAAARRRSCSRWMFSKGNMTGRC